MKKLWIFVLLALLLTTSAPRAQAQGVRGASAEIIEVVAAMQFPDDNSDVELPCPICGETVTWIALHMDAEINTQDTRRLKNRHIYMTGDIVGTDIYDPKSNTGGFMFRTNKENEHSVIHLNGYALNASQGVLMAEYGEVSIVGDGEAWGRRNNPDYGSSLDVRGEAAINIYGGTYYRNSPQPMVKILEEGTFNLYRGTLEGNDGQETGSIRVEGGTCNLYGGLLESGYGSREGSNLTVEPEGTAVIYGGELVGGKDGVGGNILTSGTLEIHGGEISGNVKQMDGSLTITGGQFNSAIVAENATITGGTFTTDVTEFVKEGVKVSHKDGICTVGGEDTEPELPWLWIAVGGAAVLAAVVLLIVVSKKKNRQTEPEEA